MESKITAIRKMSCFMLFSDRLIMYARYCLPAAAIFRESNKGTGSQPRPFNQTDLNHFFYTRKPHFYCSTTPSHIGRFWHLDKRVNLCYNVKNSSKDKVVIRVFTIPAPDVQQKAILMKDQQVYSVSYACIAISHNPELTEFFKNEHIVDMMLTDEELYILMDDNSMYKLDMGLIYKYRIKGDE